MCNHLQISRTPGVNSWYFVSSLEVYVTRKIFHSDFLFLYRETESVSAQSCLTLCGLMDCSPQTPLSMEFFRQEYWRGFPFPPPVGLPDPGIKPDLLHCRQIIYHLSHQRIAPFSGENCKMYICMSLPLRLKSSHCFSSSTI